MAAVLVASGPDALAMIDPAFTPVALVQDARQIVVGLLRGREDGERWTLEPGRVLKGGPAVPVLSLALMNERESEPARSYLRACDGKPAALFVGEEAGFLLVETVWMVLARPEGRDWRVTQFGNQDMLKTYAGGADRLADMADYILHDEDADVPVEVGVRWREQVPVARFAADVTGMEALWFGAGPGALLFVASLSGDRLFSCDAAGGAFEDVTAMAALDTASRLFALVDADRDGLIDLASWDGAGLSVLLGRQERVSAPAPGAGGWPAECASLAAVSPGQDGSPGLLMGTDPPLLLDCRAQGWVVQPLPGGEARGVAMPCVVVDWDGDGYADVLQLGNADGRLWRGRQGGFADPEPCSVRSGGLPVRWAVDDFDGDGRPDLFVSGADECQLWENDGAGGFRQVIGYAGSLAFEAEPGAAECLATDLNHDGRPDLMLLYADGTFQYHFNRGYRCMAEEGQLTLEGGPSELGGPMHAAVGDFDGDGAPDLAVAYAGGQVRCFFNDSPDAPRLRVCLPRGHTGPVVVSAWQGGEHPFCVGVHAVTCSDPVTWVGLRRHGECVLKWRWPGGLEQESAAEDGAEVVLPQGEAPTQ